MFESRSIFCSIAVVLLSIQVSCAVEAKGIDRDLVVACGNQDWDYTTIATIKKLLQQGADPNAQLGSGLSALQSAARSGNLIAVQDLVQRGADLEKANRFGRSRPLELAVPYVDVVNYLLKAGAKPTDLSVSMACLKRNNASLRKLVKAGGNPNAGMYAAGQNGQVDLLKRLIELGADANHKIPHGENTLHGAAREGQVEVVRFLIKQKADVNVQNADLKTPMHLAIQHNGSLQTIQTLLVAKPDLSLADKQGLSAVRLAALNGNWRVWNLLVSANRGVEEKPSGHAFHEAANDQREISKLIQLALNKDEPTRADARLALIADADQAVEWIRKRLVQNGRIEPYLPLLPLLGPSSASLIPDLKKLLTDDSNTRQISKLIELIQPGAVSKLSNMERKQVLRAFFPVPLGRPAFRPDHADCLFLARALGNEAKADLKHYYDSARVGRRSIAKVLYDEYADNAEIEDRLLQQLRDHENKRIRQEAARTIRLCRAVSEQAEKVCLEIVARKIAADSSTIQMAGHILAKSDAAFIRRLRPMLSQKDQDARWSAIAILHQMGDNAVEVLVEMLADPNLAIADAASIALRRMKSHGSAVALKNALDSDRQQVVRLACEAIAWKQPIMVDAIPALLRIAESQEYNHQTRAVAVRAAIRTDRSHAFQAKQLVSAVPSLIHVLQNGELPEKRDACESLRMFGASAKNALPALEAIIDDPDFENRVSSSWSGPILFSAKRAIASIEADVSG